jgi:hypothetical protein
LKGDQLATAPAPAPESDPARERDVLEPAKAVAAARAP